MRKISVVLMGVVTCVAGAWGVHFIFGSQAVAENIQIDHVAWQRPGSGIRPGSGFQQGSGSGRVIPAQPMSYEAKLWDWLQKAQYRNWAAAPGQGEDAYAGQSPHGAFLKMYINRTAATNLKTLPQGSILIKENFGKDGKTLMAVTVMYRAKGFDPEHFDWYWVKYNPDGTVALTPPDKGRMKIAGKFKSCIDCHAGAEGNDFAFFNDAK